MEGLKKENNNNLIIKVGIALLVIIGIVVYFLTRKREIKIMHQHMAIPLPYIFNRDFYNKLLSFVQQSNFPSSLLLYGAQGVGKSSGINKFSEDLTENGQLSIVFKFKSLSHYATKKDLNKIIRHSILSAFQNLDGKNYNSTLLRDFFPLIEAFSGFTDSKQFVMNQTLYNQASQRKATTHGRSGFRLKDTNIQIVAEFLLSLQLDSLLGVRAFFEALDALVPLIHPVIFVENLENILPTEKIYQNSDISQFATNFLKSVERFSKENRSLPIIFEVSDERSLFDQRFPSDRSYLSLFPVLEFSSDDATKLLVNEKNIFKSTEFSTLTDSLGFNGELLSDAHYLMGEGSTAEDAVELILKDKRDSINRALIKGNAPENLKIVKLLLANELKKDIVLEKHGLRFLKYDLVTFTNSSKLTVQNKAIEKALRGFVDLNAQ